MATASATPVITAPTCRTTTRRTETATAPETGAPSTSRATDSPTAPTWRGLAGLSTVSGIRGVRLNIVIPGFVGPELEGLDIAFVDSRLLYDYFPSGWEWLSTIGLIAAVVLAFSIALELLPVYGREEVQG